jgi:hypothetical protein
MSLKLDENLGPASSPAPGTTVSELPVDRRRARRYEPEAYD